MVRGPRGSWEEREDEVNGGEELDGDRSADCGRLPLAPLVTVGHISEPANPTPSTPCSCGAP